jgi:hypothetical protein
MWIKTFVDALRIIAKDSSAADVGLLTAERRVREFLDQYGGDPQMAIGEITKVVRAEAEANPSQREFWKAVEEYVVLPNRFRP